MVAHAAAADVQPLEVARLAPRIERIRFQSTVLGEARHFIVVLPKSFDREKKDHASLVFLHGRGRNPQSLIEHPASRESLLNAEFVTLFPEGDIGWYIDSPANPKARYASYLEEVIELAVNRYGLSRQPAKRALAGWSMGGYGCVRFAQTHAGQFAAVSPILGLLDYPRSPESFPPDQRYPVRTEYFSTDPAVWKTLNPMTSADRMSGSSILLITADQAFDRTMNERFSRKLDELRIPHRLKMLQGTHSMTVVREAVPLVISHTQSVFRRQTPNRPAASSSTGDATPRPSERVDMPEPAPNASPTTNH
jgi:S-formylglutathione hydrolase FrmB